MLTDIVEQGCDANGMVAWSQVAGDFFVPSSNAAARACATEQQLPSQQPNVCFIIKKKKQIMHSPA
jgi:hypothetical protein